MSENKLTAKNKLSADWLVRGVLTKIGETFDRLTGRNWKPSSSLATSELIERLKTLLDLEVRDMGEKGSFVPHNLKLKMQWDKFSTDAESSLKTLENELLIAAVDHINDRLYHTFAPLNLEIKPDYFTKGVKILASFDKFDENGREAELNITLPDAKVNNLINHSQPLPKFETENFTARFSINGIEKVNMLAFPHNERLSIGRTKENDLTIEDASISKIHASLALNTEKQIMVADTGSTNGTFINDERIAYGKAFLIPDGAKVKFGTVEVSFEYLPKPAQIINEEDSPQMDSVKIGGFEFRSKTAMPSKPEIKIEDRPTENIVLQPIENSTDNEEVLSNSQPVVTEFEKKN